jgi:hypothetical protein
MVQIEHTLKELIGILCLAIEQKRVIKFYFESKSGNTGWRKIRPYMIAVRENGEVYVAGLPEEKLSVSNDRQPGQYALTKIDLSKFEVTEETFSDPEVSREIVVHVKQVKIICRFI